MYFCSSYLNITYETRRAYLTQSLKHSFSATGIDSNAHTCLSLHISLSDTLLSCGDKEIQAKKKMQEVRS